MALPRLPLGGAPPGQGVRIGFGGHVEQYERDGRMCFRTVDTEDVLAVPYDIPVVGYGGRR